MSSAFYLERAVVGDAAAVEEILIMYEPLIAKYSRIDGLIDEDLYQNLVLHIISNISRFKIK